MKKLFFLFVASTMCMIGIMHTQATKAPPDSARSSEFTPYAPNPALTFTEDDRRTLIKLETLAEDNKDTINRLYSLQNIMITLVVAMISVAAFLYREVTQVKARLEAELTSVNEQLKAMSDILKAKFPSA